METRDSYLIELPLISDPKRGSLSFGEVQKQIPFEIKRVYYVFDVPKGKNRGNHANKFSEQVLFCLKGAVKIEIDDGKNKDSVLFSKPNVGIFLGKMLWRRVDYLEEGSVVLVLASEFYQKDDYISDYSEFKEIASKI